MILCLGLFKNKVPKNKKVTMCEKKITTPITAEAGDGELILGAIDPNNPHQVNINPGILAARQKFLIRFAQEFLWNPAAEETSMRDIFAVGMECGQYGMPLAEVLAFGRSIGCQVIQPSANHINLARAATDRAYRLEVWETFRQVGMPLTSVSIHCDAYAALAILDNPRADMFTPPELKGLDCEGASYAHLKKLALMFIGAAQFGIQDLHLFWGMPDNLPPYGWAPQSPADVLAMRKKFVALVAPLLALAKKLGISTGHEIHFGTIAMTADDLIAVWEMLGKPDNFCVGIDPSHFWHGETGLQAMDKLRKAGMKIVLAHAKNAVVYPGRPMLGLEMDDRLRGMSFTSLDNPAGIVSMWDYLGALTLSGIVEHWFRRGLPVPVHVEAENPFFDIAAVTTQGVKYLRKLTNGLKLPKGHFTDAMRREQPAETPAPAQPELPLVEKPAETTKAAAEAVIAGANMADEAPTEAIGKVAGISPAQTGDHASAPASKVQPKKETVRIKIPPQALGATSNLGQNPFAVPLPSTPTAAQHATTATAEPIHPSTAESGPTAQEAAAAS